ncbi:MAG: hypothetical protein HKL89_01820 [Candidatus Dormibacteraeota bacterium]|nr:hypothetical protein [Candidatus Dormibacteraeota bacterium]
MGLAIGTASARIGAGPGGATGLGSGPGGNRSAGRALAVQLLGSASLPPGSQSLPKTPTRSLAVPQQTVASGDLIDLKAYFLVPMGATSCRTFVETHPPLGTIATESGSGGGPGVPTLLSMTFSLAHLPAFAQVADLEYSLQGAPDQRAYLRLDAQVVWRPVRRPGTLIPRSDRVAIAEIRGSGGGPGLEPRILQIRGLSLAKLISAVNSEPTFAPGLVGCGLVNQQANINFFPLGPTSVPNASIQVEVNCAAFQLKTPVGAVELQSQPTVRLLTTIFRAA